jgi:methionyl-tRNA formyltransferase
MIRVALAGSVSSTFVTLEKLLEHKLEVACVFGYEPENTERVSGYACMRPLCEENNILYTPFNKINSSGHADLLKELQPDVFFVVGLSQLVSQELLSIPRLGCIGFHPTLLPKGRGRAPIAWLVLNEKEGAANFFLMGDGADDGPIFVQEPFDIEEQDDARAVEQKILEAIGVALDQWLPSLKRGEWNPVAQEEMNASYYGVRTPEDGWINWEMSAFQIDRLIKASAPPHPGAYSFFREKKLIITKSRIEHDIPIRGVVGRVLAISSDNEYLVQCGAGLVWVGAMGQGGESMVLRVGQKLGYYTELEIHQLKQQIAELKKSMAI